MSPIPALYKSAVRKVVDLIDELQTTTGNPEIAYHDWESRADENKLPKVTLLGIDGFTFEENRGLWVVRFGIGLSSWQDTNLLNEMEMLGVIHAMTGEGTKFAYLDPETGEELSELVVAAWNLSPMAQTQLRNYRTISIELLRTAGDGLNI